MAQYLSRPTGDIKANWTENPGGPAWDCLNEVVTQPTAPSTGGDQIDSATNGQQCQISSTQPTLGAGEMVTSVVFWCYIATPATRSCAITLSIAGQLPATTVPAGTAASWQSATFTGNATQAQLTAAFIDMTNGTGTGTTSIYAAYLEINTRQASGLPILGVG